MVHFPPGHSAIEWKMGAGGIVATHSDMPPTQGERLKHSRLTLLVWPALADIILEFWQLTIAGIALSGLLLPIQRILASQPYTEDTGEFISRDCV